MVVRNGHYGNSGVPRIRENIRKDLNSLNGLRYATYHKLYDTVKFYINDLFDSNLPVDIVKRELNLLDGKIPIVVFSSVCFNDDEKMMDIYFKAILSSSLGFSDKMELIMMNSAVESALMSGHLSIGKSFFKNILSRNLQDHKKLKALSLKHDINSPRNAWTITPGKTNLNILALFKPEFSKYLSPSNCENLTNMLNPK